MKTMKGSEVIAKMAGIESVAKRMSEVSMANRAMNIGVVQSRPFLRMKKLAFSKPSVTETKRRSVRTAQFFPGSNTFSFRSIIISPVASKNAPKR